MVGLAKADSVVAYGNGA